MRATLRVVLTACLLGSACIGAFAIPDPAVEQAYLDALTGITVGPMLLPTEDMHTSVGVNWVTKDAGIGMLEYGVTNIGEFVLTETNAATQHYFLLSGLQPGMRYKYRVETGSFTSKVYSFRTCPTDGSFRLMTGNDWHFQGAGSVSTSGQWASFSKIYPDMMNGAPDVIMLQGDTWEGWWSGFYQAMDLCRDLFAQAVVIPTMGNHEASEGHAAEFEQLLHIPGLSTGVLSYVYGRVHVISVAYYRMSNLVRDPHPTWPVISSNTDWRVLSGHHPPAYAHDGHGSPAPFDGEFAAFLTNYPVDFYVYGHDHDVNRTYPIRQSAAEPTAWGIVGSGNASNYFNVKGSTIYATCGSLWYSFSGVKPDLYHAPFRGVTAAQSPAYETVSFFDFTGRTCHVSSIGRNRSTGAKLTLDDFTVDNTGIRTDMAPLITGGPQASAGAHEATIAFQTDLPAGSLVRFGKASGQYSWMLPQENICPAWTTNHVVLINCLDQSTVYYYRVEASRAEQTTISAEGVFTTAVSCAGMTMGKFDFGFAGYGPAVGCVKDVGLRTNGCSWFGWDKTTESTSCRANGNESNLAAFVSEDFGNLMACCPTNGGLWTVALPNGTYDLAVLAGGVTYLPEPYQIMVQGQKTFTPTNVDALQTFTTTVAVTDGKLRVRGLMVNPASIKVAKLNGLAITVSSNTAPVVTVAATGPAATEAGPTAGEFTFSRGTNTSGALLVKYTVGGAASNGEDYAWLPGSVTIPDGQSNATVAVAPVNDTAFESSEAVTLTVADDGLADYLVGTPPSEATVTIVDDDGLPGFNAVANGRFDASDTDTWGVGLGGYPDEAGDVANIGNWTVTVTNANETGSNITINVIHEGRLLWRGGLDAISAGATVNVRSGGKFILSNALARARCATMLNGGTLALLAGSIYTGATINVAGDSILTSPSGSGAMGSLATATVTGGGKLTVTNTSALSATFSTGSTWTGNWDMAIGGTITVGSTFSNTVPRGLRIAAGTMLYCYYGGTLRGPVSGNGTIQHGRHSDRFIVGSGASLSPGDNGPGRIAVANNSQGGPWLIFASNSTYVVEIAGTTTNDYDLLTVWRSGTTNGQVDVQAGASLDVTLFQPGSNVTLDATIIDTTMTHGDNGLLTGSFTTINWRNTNGWSGLTVTNIGNDLHVQGSYTPGAADANTNGIPDAWETQYFGSTTSAQGAAVADWDGDGLDNRGEWVAGTNPTNDQSVLALSHLVQTAGNWTVLRWSSESNRYYTLKLSTNLLLDPFGEVLTHRMPSIPPANAYTDQVDRSGGAYYRITVDNQ